MSEIASAGGPVQCTQDGRMLLQHGFVPEMEETDGRKQPKRARVGSHLRLAPVHESDQEGSGAKTGVAAESVEALIAHKHIGERIKALRQRKHMGLVEMGRYTGLSASFLSQLETGRVVPTLRNLARIAMVFSKDLRYFFEPEQPEMFRILRASERQRQPQTGAEKPNYFFESLGHVPSDQTIVPYVAEFVASGERRPPGAHQHPGAEFLYVLSGELRLTHEGRTEILECGDAVYFDPSAKHSYEQVGEEPCSALILTMPEQMGNGHAALRSEAAAPHSPAMNNGNGMERREA